MNLKRLLAGLMLCLCTFAAAEDAPRSENLLSLTGEVFLKGSVDGKQMFMVLGVKDGYDISKNITQWAVRGEDLLEIKNRVVNEDHDNDLVSAARAGARVSADLSQHIFTAPWKSLQEIPGAFQVNIDRAQNAYYGAPSTTIGALKYGGWAAVAMIQGSYYLVIEAPVKFVGLSLGTGAAIPASLAIQGLRIAWATGVVVLKYSIGTVAVAAVGTYSFVSSSIATVLSAVAAGGVATYNGGKWLVYEVPRRWFYPVVATVDITTIYSYQDQEMFANQIEQAVIANGRSLGVTSLSSKIGRYNSSLRFFTTLANGKKVHMATLNVLSNRGKVKLAFESPMSYFKAVRAEYSSTRDKALDQRLKAQIVQELSKIAQSVNTWVQPNEQGAPRIAIAR